MIEHPMTPPPNKLSALARDAPAPERFASDTYLPVAPAQLQTAMATVYHAAVEGGSRKDLLQMICMHLAEKLAVPLVMLARKSANGSIPVEAASSESALWRAFNRIGERWDGGVTSHGPANCALRANEAVRLSFAKDPLALWADAAQQDRVTEVVAWPVMVGGATFVVEVFSTVPLAAAYGRAGTTIDALTRGLVTLLADLERIERQ